MASFAEIWDDSTTGEKSLHSSTKFMPGDTIAKLGAKKVLEEPNYLSVQVSDREHIMLEPEFLQYINHSCEPNVLFDTANMLVVCLKQIDVGDAMTFFYPSTEWSMAQTFNCLCETEKCLGKIRGAAHIPLNIIHNYDLTEYIKQRAYRAIDN